MRKSNDASFYILGIGNPDDEYGNTYHNAGKLFVAFFAKDSLENQETFSRPTRKDFSFLRIDPWICGLSQTFMNESGRAAHEFSQYFDIPPSQLFIAHDDSDQLIGTYKISFGQSAGGHNGISSIITSLGTSDFGRIKIGVRRADEELRRKAGDFVLNTISKEDSATLKNVFKNTTEDLKKKI